MRDLREWLERLHDTDRLAVMQRGVSLQHELTALLVGLEGRKVCFFPEPSGHKVPVVGGTLGNRAWVEEVLGVTTGNLLAHVGQSIASPLGWGVVPQDRAPVHEVVYEHNINLSSILPVVTTSEYDGGPYITSGLVNAANLQNGKQNLSIHRMQLQACDTLSILMLPRDLHAYYKFAESTDRPLPVTITIGHDPVIKLASQVMAPRDVCELEIAGALKREPLRVTRSYTNEIFIPADAEFSIEGEILPHFRALEGPFGEFARYYGEAGLHPIIKVKCVTHRRDPIYETTLPSGFENIVTGGVSREAAMLLHINEIFPNVIDLRLTPGGVGRFHLVIKMHKQQYGEAKNVIAHALSCHYDIKQVIVVDDDIDIDDPLQVEWAVATRFQADRDLVILHHALGSKLDPSGDSVMRGLSSKLGMDATRYMDGHHEFFVARVASASVMPGHLSQQKDSSDFLQYLRSDEKSSVEAEASATSEPDAAKPSA
ncbi:UbiD family decarboxylase [Burkholderia sp. Bp8986]|uniref:UbiD family decarboxylase n=1 Tax=Burkholderia sp. Bp8986 TaxID=2184550 RepID=UPI000F5B20C2|nr:UbiD family decarboxylase [Burkholderia sp. Bp8986]RQS43399.1 UbiD family decarboxylase [Burkholderia sp. Bp8986]